MFKKLSIIVCIIPFLLVGCVSQSDYDTLEKEKGELSDQLSAVVADLDSNKKKLDEQAKQLVELEQLHSENEQLKKKLDLYRSEVNSKAEQGSNYNSTVEEEYINNLLEVYDFKAAWMNSLLDGKVPGVVFKIKNKGQKTISEIEVTVYFNDGKGNNIAEESYHPVYDSITSDYKELKPNYTFQLESDRFYSTKTVPEEWKSGNATIEITNIKFKEE